MSVIAELPQAAGVFSLLYDVESWRHPGHSALAGALGAWHGLAGMGPGIFIGAAIVLLTMGWFARPSPGVTDRTREALRQAQAELQAIYDGMVDGILIADTGTGRFLRTNSAMCQMLGYTKEELLCRSVSDIHPPDRLEDVLAEFAAMAEGAKDRVTDIPCLRKDGTVFFADIGVRIVALAGQRCNLGLFRDVTARKQAEEAFRDREANVRAILNSSTESALLIDTEGRILAANEAVARRYGRREDELAGVFAYDLLPPQLGESRAARVAEVVRSRQPVRFEDEHNGRHYQHHVYPVLDGQGQVTRLALFARDDTEERRQHGALRENEERFRAMAAAAPNPIVISREPDGVILYANDLLGELFGLPTASIPTRCTLDFYADLDDRVRLREVLQRQGYVKNYEMRARKADGTPFWIAVSMQRMTYQGQPALISSLCSIDEQKHAEETLRRQALALESLYDGVLVTNLENRITDCNRGAEQLFGYAKSEILGRNPEMLNRPEDAAALTREIQSRLRAGERWEGEVQAVRKDGTERCCDTVVVPLLDAGGGRFGAVSVIRDITARKRVERALQREQQAAQRYLDTVPTMVVVINADQTVGLINQAGIRLLGRPAEAIVGKNWFDGCIPQRLREAARRVFTQLATGKADSCEYFENPVLTADGSERLIAWHNTVVRDEAGAIIATLSCGEDITERTRAEAALRESETKFRTVTETLEAAVLVCRGSQVVFANPAATRISGYTWEELRDRPFWEWIDPEDQALARRQGLAQQLAGAGPARYEARIRTKLGGERWLDISAAPFVLEGQPVALLTALDVTARRRAEASSRQYQAELAKVARLSTMGQFAAQLSHELNQPLTAIHNYAKGSIASLQAGRATPTELMECLARTAALALRAGQLIRHLRDVVSGREPCWGMVDMNEVVREVHDIAGYQAHAAHVRLELALAESLPCVRADRVGLGQVVLNLVSNAIEALAADDGPDRRVTVTTRPTEPGGIEVAVCDTGPGIAPQILEQVFSPFVSTRDGGMGLGLAICRSIVEDHRGRIWAAPNQDRGTTFRFTLPAPAVQENEPDAEPAR